ncbi:MAG: LacI family DNA-binding transcriptional regulator [Winogradskyella sp.]|uniref:LacI family DNA-binding transcriptional regulator n=1 Tax=Winogradskyella sp. TaxID=1883156 RepID=UPI00385C840F
MKSSVVTIKQISSLSGYSISTVSKALNDKFEISTTTREKIKAIAKRHNYVPNNYAVSLRNRTTKSIAVILPKVTEECYSHALCHLQKSAERLGYRILFFQSFDSKSKALNYIKKFSDGSIDGIIMISKDHIEANAYTHNYIPVEALHITRNESLENIKGRCINSLAKLLQRAEV